VGGSFLPLPLTTHFLSMVFIKDQLEKNLWQIHEPWFSEHANLYLILGSQKSLLIDTGLGLEHLPSWLKARGVVPDIIVTTHSHFDHCGGLHQFPTGRVFLTPIQATNLQKPSLWGLNYLKSNQITQIFDQTNSVKNYKPISPKSWNTFNNIIDLGNYKISVIEMSGHTDDSVVFFEEKNRWLFTGDILYRGKLFGNFPNTDITKWRKSLQTITDLAPKIIFPGHNESFSILRLPTVVEDFILQLERIKK